MRQIKFFEEQFESSSSFAELFELVKVVVKRSIGRERTSLMLGFAELGVYPNGFVGGFHPVGSNIIVMNKTAAKLIASRMPELYKAYCFHILLHEYLHTLGFLDELNTRVVAHLVSKETFGENHPTAVVSSQFNEMLKGIPLHLCSVATEYDKNRIEIVDGFDISNTNYIG